ncbi:MAG: tetratricopeptide repeat protein [Chitinophagaceae bacterium]
MNTVLRNFLLLATAVTLFSACNNNDESSPYSSVLSLAPYSSLTDSIKNDRKNDVLYFHRALALKKNNLPEPALADFKKAWSLKQKEEYAANITNMLLENKPDSVVAFATEALKKIPSSIFIKLDLARAYTDLSKKDEALNVCDDIIREAPGQIDALMMKSDLLEEKQDTAGSVAALEKAYSLAPFDQELNFNLAYKYAESKNPKALSLCDSLIKKDSAKAHPEPFYFKGVYYSNINDKQKAIENFDKAIQQDYNFHNAYLEKGKAIFDQNKIKEALKVFTLLSTISPSFPDAYYWIAKCQQVLGQNADAKLNYQRAYGLDKTFTEAKDSADRIK